MGSELQEGFSDDSEPKPVISQTPIFTDAGSGDGQWLGS